jgi:hypothetical protein
VTERPDDIAHDDLELPEADALEQRQPWVPDDDAIEDEPALPPDVPEADALEQARVVPLDDEV